MKIKTFRELTNEELNKKISENKKELFNLRMKQATGNMQNSSKVNELRKDVARMKTILREREIKEDNYGE